MKKFGGQTECIMGNSKIVNDGGDGNYSNNTDGGDHGVDGSEWCDDVDCGSDDDNYGNG